MEEKREKVNKEENVVESNNVEKKDEARKKVDKAVNDYVKEFILNGQKIVKLMLSEE